MTRLIHRRRGRRGAVGVRPGSPIEASSVSSAANVLTWVCRLIIKTDLEMQVRARAEPGAALVTDPLAFDNRLPIADCESRHVAIESGKAVGVDDDYVVAVAAAPRRGIGDATIGGVDLGAVGAGDVDPGVEVWLAGRAAVPRGRGRLTTEIRAAERLCDRTLHPRPGEDARRMGTRARRDQGGDLGVDPVEGDLVGGLLFLD